MPMIEGGNIITGGTVIAGAKRRVIYVSTFASGAGSDAKVGGGYWTPAAGQLVAACDTGYLWENTGVNTYVRKDTL